MNRRAGNGMAEARFNDEEVALILRRALEEDQGRGDGLTLGQLKEIAGEVGIDPVRVESAALAVRAQRLQARVSGGGVGVSTRYEVELPGEVDAEDREDLLRLIRGAMGRQGVVTDEGGGVHWRARDFFGGRYFTIRSKDGRTRVEALGNFRDGAFSTGGMGATGGLAVTAVVIKATVGGIGGLGLLGPAALAVGAAVPGYLLYRRWFAREDRALRSAVSEIAAHIGRSDEALPPADESG